MFSGRGQRARAVAQGDKAVGSRADRPEHARDYFWGRRRPPGDSAYNPRASAGNSLAAATRRWIQGYRRTRGATAPSPAMSGPIPVDLLTASGSEVGSCEISIAAAQCQLARVAAARSTAGTVAKLIDDNTDRATPNFMGNRWSTC
ncbi:potassium-transporting ATPase subunit C [Serratia ureilytica]